MAWFKKKEKRSVTVSPETAPDCALGYQAANLQGVGARNRQEDSFTVVNALDEQLCRDYGMMFAVCDGMGGMKDGRLASETAVNSFRTFFKNMNRRGSIAEQLKESMFYASDAVEKCLGGDGGSTAVIGIILHEQLYFASVGDSAFLLKRNGLLYHLNLEQNYCRQCCLEQIRCGDFNPEPCRADPEAAALVQFLGMPGLSEIDYSVRPLQLKKGDILMACSDGVSGILSDAEICRAMEAPSAQDICRELERGVHAHANPSQDNYTALIVKCI